VFVVYSYKQSFKGNLLMKKFMLAIAAAFGIATSALAWTPDKPITVIIGWSGGSQNEAVFREIAEIVKRNNPGVEFILLYKPGVENLLANNYLVTLPPNGLSVGVPSIAVTVITNDLWNSDVKRYNWENCSVPVVLGETYLALIATSDSKVNNLSEFMSLTKNSQQAINVATAGGSALLAYSNLPIGNPMVGEVRYKTSVETAVAVASKQTEFGITAVGVVAELAKAGKLKIIATSDNQKNKEFGVSNGFMLMLPPGTPADIVEWYETEFGRAIQDPGYQQWAQANGIRVNPALRRDSVVRRYLYNYKNRFTPKP
jgi:tripartite-type tricarboxylate transporter receptor subunit TctC